MSARFTIVLVVLLILIGGLVAVTQILRVDTEAPKRSDRLYRIQDVAHVVISRGEESITFEKMGNTWFIKDEEGGEDVEVDIGRWGGIPSLLNGPAVSTNLMKTEEDRKQLGDRVSYGLDPVRTVITVTSANGQMVVVNLGDLTPTEDGYYVSVEDPRDNLYIVHNSWVDVLERLLTEPPYPVEEG
jgi:hypothetical protein